MNRALLAAVAVSTASAAEAASDCAATGLLEKTQSFSDAGQRGDGPGMGRLLDDRVIFINEGGDQADKAALASAVAPPTSAPKSRINVTDWQCQLHGNVAVATFIDDQVIDGPSPFHARYRSVETWLDEGGQWQMIGSETIALPDDPASVNLPARELDEYVGTYRALSGQIFVFSRQGSRLEASSQGSAPTPQLAEVRDVFFTPGRSRFRKVFKRNEEGHVVAFSYRREGHDTVFTKVSAKP